jgi:hypothetical protein
MLTPSLPSRLVRRNVKALIEDKVRWGRGRGPDHPAPGAPGAPSGVAGGVRQLALAPARPVPPEERARRREEQKERAAYRPARAEERAAALQEAAAQRVRRAAEARARKAAHEEEYRQWQRGVALRIDDAAQLEGKAERERERGLALWLGGVKAWAFLAAVGPRVLAERARRTQEQEMLRAALRVQSTFRCFIQLRVFNARLRRIKMLCEELRPKMSMFLLRYNPPRPRALHLPPVRRAPAEGAGPFFGRSWRQRRRRMKADVVRGFLVEFMKTNKVSHALLAFALLSPPS